MKIDGYDNWEVPVRPVHFVLASQANKSCQTNPDEKKILFHALKIYTQNYI
jgi:hypothetical protein